MNTIQKRRMRILAKFLLSVPEERLNMKYWFHGKFCGRKNEVKHNCGTAACALGWATTIPSFKRDGLIVNQIYQMPMLVTKTKNAFGPDLAEVFFGINSLQYDYIFGSTVPSVPKHVSNRILEVIEWNEQADKNTVDIIKVKPLGA